MTAADLYALADAHGHACFGYPLPECGSLAVEIDGRCYIGLDPRLFGRSEKERLAHELGHCEFGGFYNRFSDFDVIGRAERRADKWAFVHLCPIELVRQHSALDLWELADHFGVSEHFLRRALAFYRESGIM